MENKLLKLIYLIVHVLVEWIETFYYFGLEFRDNLSSFITNVVREGQLKVSAHEKVHIEHRLHDLDKFPKHLAVLLNINRETDVDLSRLADLVSWSLSSGVNFISFYDSKGILKHRLSRKFYETIQKQLDINSNENIVWGPDYQNTTDIKFPHRNGYRRHIIINLYSSHDSYGSFNQLLTHNLSKTPSQQISIDLVDEKLNKLFGNIPDPELAIYFGNSTCTAGFLPWHIRLTEFIQISYKLKYLSLDKYLRVLYKYARCEQRFGK